MLTFYQLPPAFGLPVSVSPFCTKLEAYFRLAGVEHERADADLRKAPNGKVPYVKDGDWVLGDSSQIVAWSKETHGDPLDEWLTEEQHHLGHLAKRTAEEHLYWPLLYSRWVDDAGWVKQRAYLMGLLPSVLGALIAPAIRRSVRKSIEAHGVGLHPKPRIYDLGVADLDALLGLIGDSDYLFGDRPTSYDCCLYGMMIHCRGTQTDNALTTAANKMPALVAYTDRMTEALAFE